MRSLRCALLAAITIAAYAASTYTDYAPLAPGPASAQEPPVALSTAVAGVTNTFVPAAMMVPTPTFTPTMITAATDPPAPIDTATAATSPTATATAVASATPPVPATNLPPLAQEPDGPGATADAPIATHGGRISSRDGHAVIDFPVGAITEDLTVTVTRRSQDDLLPPSPDFPLLGLWSFDAARADGTALHSFNKDLTVTLRFTPRELRGRDPNSLRYWSFDDATQRWIPAPAFVDAAGRTLVAKVNHFSLSGATASPIVDAGPLLLGDNVGLQTGSAVQSVPIQTAPGRAGLAPQLNLSYDSMRVEEMRSYSALSGWAGQGWELGTGSVQIAYEPTGSRFFLEGKGFGGEMMADPTDASSFRLRDEQYLRVRSSCDDRLTAFGTNLSPRQISTRGLDGTWSSPLSVAGITSSHPRVYPLTDTLWFATNDNDSDSVAGTGAGARTKDGGNTWSATPAPPWGAHGGIKHLARDAGGRVWMTAHDWVSNSAYTQTRVFYSDNDGDNWTLSTTLGSGGGVPVYAGWKLLPHPANQNIIAIIGDAWGLNSPGDHAGFLAYTTNRGATWAINRTGLVSGQLGVAYVRDAAMLPTGRIVAVGQFGTGAPVPFSAQISDDYGVTFASPWGVTGIYTRTLGPFHSADGARVAFLYTPAINAAPQTIDLMLSTDFGASFTAAPLAQSLRDFLGADPGNLVRFASSPGGDALYTQGAGAKKVVKLSPVSAAGVWSDLTGNYPFTSEGHHGMSVIPQGYIGGDCPFYVTDKAGTVYAYGTDDAHRRWYLENNAGTWVRRYYRLDLAFVVDVLGNRVDYTYWQEKPTEIACGTGPQCQWVMAAYPEDIFYNYEGTQAQAQVHFTTASDQNNAALGRTPAVWVRTDTPYDAVCGAYTYTAPKVMETRRLTGVDINVRDAGAWQLARRYTLAYSSDTINESNFSVDATCQPFTRFNKLESVALKGKDGTSVLTTRSFTYAAQHHAFDDDPNMLPVPDDVWGYDWPHLTQATNGVGGSVAYAYTQQGNGCACLHWTHAAVTTETRSPGGVSQPNIVTTYSYTGPYQWNWPDPNRPTTVDEFNSEGRGYTQTVETDAAGNRTIHSYRVPTTGWADELVHGREYNTRVEDNSAARWHEVGTTWSVRSVANYNASLDRYYVNFVYPSATTTTLRDGTVMTTNNTFDDGQACAPPAASCYGLLTRQDNLGVSGTGDDVSTKTAYQKETTNWIFKPKYKEVVDPTAGDAMLSCSKSFYDGAKLSTSSPTKGLVTATSSAVTGTAAQCEGAVAFTTSTNTYAVYDAYGNVVQASVPDALAPENVVSPGGSSGWVPAGVASGSAVYDTTHRVYPTSTANALGQQTTYGYDFVLGKPTATTAPTGYVTNLVYDTFGRVSRAYDNKETDATPTSVRFTYTWGAVPNRVLTETKTVHNSATAYHSSVSCMDGFGRAYESREQFSGTTFNSVRTDYDNRGLVAAQANAVSDGTSSACPTTPAVITTLDRAAMAYDSLGNVTTTTFLAANQFTGPSTLSTYNGLTSSFRDERLYTTTDVTAPLARTLTVTEPTAAATVYTHDRLGQLTTVNDPLGNVTSLGYDLAGRKTAMSDPDMGSWTYGYNAAGSLTSQTDARNITTTLTYDALQRLAGKTYSNGDPAVAFTYDSYPDTAFCSTQTSISAIGMLTRMTDGSGQTLSCYDIRGRAEKTRHTVSSTNYDLTRTFDALDRVENLTYPDGEIVHHTYDTTDTRLTGICKWTGSACSTGWDTYLSGATRTAFGAPASLPFGMGRTTSYTYDFRMRLKTLATSSSLQNLTLNYDDASNITSVADTAGTAETVTYAYDSVNRLTGGTGFTGGLTASYTYNNTNNLLTKQEGSSNLTLNYPASGPGSVRPHAVTSTTGSQSLSLTYDANGNLATQGGTTYTFDAENRLKTRTVTGGTVTYLYDGNGATVKRTNADGTSTVYVEGIYEKDSSNTVRKYYQAYGRPVAMRDVPSGSGTVYYLLADHLGGTLSGLKKQGSGTSAQWSFKYWPFGNTRTSSGTAKSDKLFTGQRQEPGDAALGLYNYNARFYSTTLGRFASVDPVAGAEGDPQAWNAYAYVRNNPLIYSDPTGMNPFGDAWDKTKDIVGAGIDKFKDVVLSAGDKAAECWASQICKTAVVTGGVVACSFTAVGATACGAAGAAILASGDAADCVGGDAGGCGRVAVAAGIEIATAGAAKYGAPMLGRLGSRYAGSFLADESGALTIGGSRARTGWRVGDPIDSLTRAGNNPAWSTVRGRYWKNTAAQVGEEYSVGDLARMARGRAPLHPTVGVSKELHHVVPRFQGGSNALNNLEALWPWDHAAVDPYRFYSGAVP